MRSIRRTLAIAALPLLAAFQPAQPVEWTQDGYPRWSDAQMALPALPAPPPGATVIDMNLNGYVFGIKLIDADYDGWAGPRGADGTGDYALRSDLSTAGLGALLRKLRVWAVTTGTWDAAGLHPRTHLQQNRDKKRRRVEMLYDYGADTVAVSVIPPNGSQGVPPASPAERFSAEDTLSGLFSVVVRRALMGVGACEGTIPVFDSKQHYNLRLVDRGARKDWKKDGLRVPARDCDIYYEPVSGFDPEDLPDADEAATPVKVVLAEIGGLDVPVRFSYKLSGFKAVIKVDELRLQTPDGRVIDID